MVVVVRRGGHRPQGQPHSLIDLGGTNDGGARIRDSEDVRNNSSVLLIGCNGTERADLGQGIRVDGQTGFLGNFADSGLARSLSRLGFPTRILMESRALFTDGEYFASTGDLRGITQYGDSAHLNGGGRCHCVTFTGRPSLQCAANGGDGDRAAVVDGAFLVTTAHIGSVLHQQQKGGAEFLGQRFKLLLVRYQ